MTSLKQIFINNIILLNNTFNTRTIGGLKTIDGLMVKSNILFRSDGLNNIDSWRKIINQSDIIFHLSGNTSIAAAEKNPENSLNAEILPITNLLNAAKEISKKPRFIYSSTATIYG